MASDNFSTSLKNLILVLPIYYRPYFFYFVQRESRLTALYSDLREVVAISDRHSVDSVRAASIRTRKEGRTKKNKKTAEVVTSATCYSVEQNRMKMGHKVSRINFREI